MTEITPHLQNSYIPPIFSKKMPINACFHGEFSLWCRNVLWMSISTASSAIWKGLAKSRPLPPPGKFSADAHGCSTRQKRSTLRFNSPGIGLLLATLLLHCSSTPTGAGKPPQEREAWWQLLAKWLKVSAMR